MQENDLYHDDYRTQTETEHYETKQSQIDRLMSFKSQYSHNTKRLQRVKSQEDLPKKKIPPKRLPRLFDMKSNPSLGPGYSNYPQTRSYDIQQSTISTNGRSFPQSKRKIEISGSMAGPGYYNIESRKSTIPHAFKRDSIQDHPIRKIRTHIFSNSPSPQSYHFKFQSINSSKSSVWSRSRAPQRSKIDSGTPGPGQYKLMSSINRTEKITNKMNKSGKRRNTILPGPGQYNIDNGLNKSSLFFTKDKRRNDFLCLQKFVTPGPYLFHKLTQIGGAKFSKAKKPELFKIPDTPSVGFYDLLAKQSKRPKIKVMAKGYDVNLLTMIDLNQSPQKASNAEL